jgi:hypothetical protein
MYLLILVYRNFYLLQVKNTYTYMQYALSNIYTNILLIANQREAAFAPKQGSLIPPPAYGGHTDDTILFDNNNDNNESHLTYIPSSSSTNIQAPPPSYSS